MRQNLQAAKDELRTVKERVTDLAFELKEKELVISNKEKEILHLKRNAREEAQIDKVVNYDDENSINKLALKVNVRNRR